MDGDGAAGMGAPLVPSRAPGLYVFISTPTSAPSHTCPNCLLPAQNLAKIFVPLLGVKGREQDAPWQVWECHGTVPYRSGSQEGNKKKKKENYFQTVFK